MDSSLCIYEIMMLGGTVIIQWEKSSGTVVVLWLRCFNTGQKTVRGRCAAPVHLLSWVQLFCHLNLIFQIKTLLLNKEIFVQVSFTALKCLTVRVRADNTGHDPHLLLHVLQLTAYFFRRQANNSGYNGSEL